MSSVNSRAITTIISTLVALLLVTHLAQGATYAVRVRWAPSTSPNVAGYRIAVRALSGGSPPVVDAGLPPAATDGSLAADVSGLDGRTNYEVTATAYADGGDESAPSNAIAIGYAQVAGQIDSDGDGLTDAAEDPNLNRVVDAGETSALSADTDGDRVGDASDQCQGTAAGAAVNAVGCSCAQVACSGSGSTLWPSTAAPTRADGGADNAVELGVKFRSDVAGSVTGIRFYKHALNTGTHVGNLWSVEGTLLATATFTGESASGWQQVTFSPPVAIAANTTYVASYHCPNGHYSFDVSYFATQGIDRSPLHAPASDAAGGNGIFAYGATSSFPNQTYAATNYWVDLLFSTGTAPPPAAITSIWPSTAVPAVADGGPDSAAELGVKFRSDVAGSVTGIRFYKHALNTGTHVGNLWSLDGTLLATATFSGETASGWQEATFSSPVAIAANTVYVASYHCANGHYGDDRNYFSGGGVDRPPLHALETGVAGPNSVYAYGATSRFPTQTYAATNYWVDVAFSTTAPASVATTGILSGIAGPGVALRASPDASSGDGAGDATESGGDCSGPLDGPRGTRRDGGIRRFLLQRRAEGYHVTAIGRFAFPDGLDLATSGLTLVFEDGAGRPLVKAELSGADFEPTPDGWRSRSGASGIERVAVRRRSDGVVVGLRGTLPAFDLAAATSTAPPLSWRVTFGALCSDARQLACTDDPHGNRRCRGWPAAAAARSQAPRDR
jgi:uncharacterized protein DUF4082